MENSLRWYSYFEDLKGFRTFRPQPNLLDKPFDSFFNSSEKKLPVSQRTLYLLSISETKERYIKGWTSQYNEEKNDVIWSIYATVLHNFVEFSFFLKVLELKIEI